jgi:hypothetical protein
VRTPSRILPALLFFPAKKMFHAEARFFAVSAVSLLFISIKAWHSLNKLYGNHNHDFYLRSFSRERNADWKDD